MKVIKIITFIVFLGAILSILLGLIFEFSFKEKLIGFGVLALVVVVFPLFSYYRWKDKDIRDYMLTKENLDKMRALQKEKKY